MTIIAIIATISAYIIKGMCGFANTLIFSSIMSFTANNINITPTELIIGYPSNILIAYKERKSLSYKVWLPLSLLVIAGIIPGALFLKNADSVSLKVFFGFCIIAISIEMFLRERQKEKKKSSKLVLGIIGIISGMLCGLFGIGAFLAAYISRTTYNQKSFKGNLCFVFFIENTFRLILYIATGIINVSIVKTALCLIPFAILGLFIGTVLSNKTSDKLIKNLVILMLMLSGASLIINNI
ncbi:MAG: sulfite exporter TauE/SafE family protein [Clostridium sp.]|nr:sulfite exporter TauE/SafE family protein [Clostridium sp.]